VNHVSATKVFAGLFLLFSAGPIASAQGPVQITRGPVGELGPIVSPDGRWLAIEYFTTEHPDDPEVWVMPRNGDFAAAKPLLNDTGMIYGEIAWSPNSAWLSFVGRPRVETRQPIAEIYKVNIYTKQIVQLTHLGATMGGGTSWSSDGRIAFSMAGEIHVVSESGGAVAKLLDVRRKLGNIEAYFADWSPDSTRLAFVGREQGFDDFKPELHGRNLYIADLRSGKISKLFSDVGADGPSWLDQAHVLVSHQDSVTRASLWLVPVSTGKARRLTHGFYDAAPVARRPLGYLYFTRNADDTLQIQRSFEAAQFAKGFHIWRQKFWFPPGRTHSGSVN